MASRGGRGGGGRHNHQQELRISNNGGGRGRGGRHNNHGPNSAGGGRGGNGGGGRAWGIGNGDAPRGGHGVAAVTEQLERTHVTTPAPVTPAPPPPPPPPPVQEVAVVQTPYPQRPGFGRTGRPVALVANHFRVRLRAQQDICHYDLTLQEAGGRRIGTDGVPPKSLAEKIIRALLPALQRRYPTIAAVSDFRKNLYTSQPLPIASQEIIGDLDIGEVRGRDQTPRLFQASIRAADPLRVRMAQLPELFAGRLNYTPYDALQALDIVLRHTAALRLTVVGRNLYSDANAVDIGEGATAWRGYFQSLRPTQNQLVLNLDLSTTAFVKAMPVLNYVVEVLNLRDRNPPETLSTSQHSMVSKALRGVKVETTHRPGIRRTYRVNGLSPHSAARTMFEDEHGHRMSVAQYFAQHYQRLKHPDLPCVHVGAVNKKTYLPMEVCQTVQGQKCPRKMTDRQTAEMIKVAKTNPPERRALIEQKVRDANFANDPTLRSFGLDVEPNMVTLQGRQLPAPRLRYGSGDPVAPGNGAWQAIGRRFHRTANLDSFAVIVMDDRARQNDLDAFFRMVLEQAESLGMSQLKKLPPFIFQRRGYTLPDLFDEALEAARSHYSTPAKIIWMIQFRQDPRLYGELKRISDTQHGIPSQCMLSKHLNPPRPQARAQYIGNILLKVHNKIGGINWILEDKLPAVVSRVPTIIFGADVTHPSPGDRTRPSIAALVCTMDPEFVTHASVIRAQGHRVEQIVHLKDMIRELLRAFRKKLKAIPQQIVFYRDGVSEGQFQMVLNHEITAIRAACESLDPNYRPSISFIVVQKRHHTRFFGVSSNGTDRSGNVLAGTVVDTAVCHPREYDFYLMSHAGLQGTSRPAHYHVLFDEIRFNPDDLQALTYRMCFLFARCTRSVSMVSTAYYSHVLAYRARFFTSECMESSSSGNHTTDTTVETDERILSVHPQLQTVQYYV